MGADGLVLRQKYQNQSRKDPRE